MNQKYFDPNPSYSSFDQPSQYLIDQSPPQEMSIQYMENLKQQYLDEMKSMINRIQIKDYRNERIDIRYRRECEIKIDELKGKFNGRSIKINKKKELQQLDVENLVPIPSEFEDTSGSDSDCDLPSCDDFSPINGSEDKSLTFANPLFDSNDDFTSSNDESLSDKDVPKDNDIESKASYDSNLDEPALLVTPFSDANTDECFDPGGDIDEIELLLHHDSSTPKLSVASILEGFTDEPPLEENGDLFDLESKENEWKKILYDAPIDDLMTEDKDCPDYEDSHAHGFVHRSLDRT
ncbi:hypothetical protein Tco_0715093, partial [Tanacetum coccineum]